MNQTDTNELISEHVKNLSPAPLWRNAPVHGTQRQISPKSLSMLKMRDQQQITSKSFQQSLRSYPDTKMVKQQKKRKMKSSPPEMNRCFVTSLEETKKNNPITPFYLDYLEWTNQQQNGNLENIQQTQFDHSKFMDMFRINRNRNDNDADDDNKNQTNQIDSHSLSTNSITTTIKEKVVNNKNITNLAFSINNEKNDVGERQIKETPLTTDGGQRQVRIQPPIEKKIFNSNLRENLSRIQKPDQQQRFKLFPSNNQNMEKNNRSQSNLTQRIQSAAERRAQIEDAKRERAQRQLEQNSMRNIIHGGSGNAVQSSFVHSSSSREQPFLPGHSTNVSLAFGSTQPRNIDLTRPLVTPLPARPKSEIFAGGLQFNLQPNTIGQSTTDSASHIYSKDDTNYRNNIGNSRNISASQCPIQATEPISVAKQQAQLQGPSFGGASSFLRAARRHDPELIPAKQRYLFREYGAPTSFGVSFGGQLKKENSMMTSSMTSTKSFQVKNFGCVGGSGNGLFGSNRPKKSFSMNRLDQLAQPRKRVQPKVPNSTSFIKGKIENNGSTTTAVKSSSGIDTDRSTKKPTPPPKNFSTPISCGGKSQKTPTSAGGERRSNGKKRPLSQIEHSNVKLETSSVLESPLNDKQSMEKTEGENEKLAEYQRQLAEKRAQYRKMQEKMNQSDKPKTSNEDNNKSNNNNDNNNNENKSTRPTVVGYVSRHPRSTSSEGKSLAEETKEAEENKEMKSREAAIIAPLPKTEKPSSNSSSSSSSSNDSSDPDTSIDPSPTVAENESKDSSISQGSFEKTIVNTLNQGIQQLSINEQTSGQTCDDSVIQTIDKSILQPNTIMTTSFDSSLLHSTSPAAMVAQQQTSVLLAKNEERQEETMKQHEIERQKRKSRIQEILKGRTRKDEPEKQSPKGDNKKINEDQNLVGLSTSKDQSEIKTNTEALVSMADNNLDVKFQGKPMHQEQLPNGEKTNKTNGHYAVGKHGHQGVINDANQTYVKTNGVHHETMITEQQDESENGSKANGF